MHHTPKTQFNPSADFSTTDFIYRGAGCASMSNWARAYLVFEPINDASYFTDATEHDFIDLPSPVSIERMTRVVVTLDEIPAAFQQRVIELKAIGHAESLEWAEDDLGKIDATIRPIEEVICHLTDEIPRHALGKARSFAGDANRPDKLTVAMYTWRHIT
jgi:hypothetical protein